MLNRIANKKNQNDEEGFFSMKTFDDILIEQWYTGEYYGKWHCPMIDLHHSNSFGTLSCYPNPFKTNTTINYDLPNPIQVTITIYDSQGKQVSQMMVRSKLSGHHTLSWNASKYAVEAISQFC